MKSPSLKDWVVKHKDMLITAINIIGLLVIIVIMQNKDAAAMENKELIKGLENIVTKCTDTGDNAIVIDNEIYICGASRTGIKVNESDP